MYMYMYMYMCVYLYMYMYMYVYVYMYVYMYMYMYADTTRNQGGHSRTTMLSATNLERVRTYGRSISTSAAITKKPPAARMSC